MSGVLFVWDVVLVYVLVQCLVVQVEFGGGLGDDVVVVCQYIFDVCMVRIIVGIGCWLWSRCGMWQVQVGYFDVVVGCQQFGLLDYVVQFVYIVGLGVLLQGRGGGVGKWFVGSQEVFGQGYDVVWVFG